MVLRCQGAAGLRGRASSYAEAPGEEMRLVGLLKVNNGKANRMKATLPGPPRPLLLSLLSLSIPPSPGKSVGAGPAPGGCPNAASTRL